MSEDQHGIATDPRDWPKTLFYVALLFSVFQIVTAAFSPVSSIVLRAVHVGFLLWVVFLSYPAYGKQRPWQPLAWVLSLGSVATALYQWVFEADLIQRSGDLTTADMIIGVILIVLVFEAARRVMGIALPIICGLFLAYGLFGEYLPGDLAHRGYGVDQIINQLSFGTEGLYGTPTYVSATYIFLFILFGAFLEKAGMIKLFTDFAMGLFGHKLGGPAKVAVVSSALMGTITGSGIANVVTTGQFTIPLMKRFGYKAAFAGGVEATSSMGSQIMPPVMGAVAFIMAETINVPFVEIAKAALIPACLYFGSVFWMVHLEAKRSDLKGLPKDQCPSAWGAVKENWYLLIPLGVLVYLLFSGRTPLFSGMVGLALTAIVILGSAIILKVSNYALRCAFWIALGLLCVGFFRLGIGVVFAVIGVLVVVCWFMQGTRETLVICLHALVDGARHAVPVGIACALVGSIIAVVSLTGVASTFAGYILAIGRDNLLLSLILTMLTCLVLGMGIPTIPNYIITSSIAAPALLELGVPLIVSHMFVFYFGILADLTPPVALACFAAAPIARESGLKISFWAVRIALAGFVIPFMAVYNPALMLQGDNLWMTAYMLIKTLLAVGLWGMASTGYLQQKMPVWERLLCFAAGALLVVALPLTDEIGFVLGGLLIFQHIWRSRRAGRALA
ncbi:MULTISPECIES: TRAP transporter permease [Pseudomonas]|uniref:Putative transporter, membrane protein n=1 Tax=Pseudomonas brassicacearum (strain NFM421) TaxID=994484 RepID=F2KIK1_PSEBN|nr:MULTISPECIES: TRAP transporter permease [Pseudomonas]EIK66093.1 TRAP transporter, 4TM/12TM fusion protein [Pseudomonas fluorescens Q8r1-96]KIR16780.1 Sialic acid TRAP transporter permease protein SiaT [Pseudomonas fluorescens]AEA69877.1 putative transporter, membrane protein [Pseudomonas brassicacearum subsp. brassicacearum NFM421]ALQ04425.1 TRAP transporter, 4TM/12TM fusion protein, unknown substrate 1 [Pseudomonas brassicacearum]AOS42378.1 C4-dicarboxylate ABC transporter [Pseudomonas bra